MVSRKENNKSYQYPDRKKNSFENLIVFFAFHGDMFMNFVLT